MVVVQTAVEVEVEVEALSNPVKVSQELTVEMVVMELQAPFPV